MRLFAILFAISLSGCTVTRLEECPYDVSAGFALEIRIVDAVSGDELCDVMLDVNGDQPDTKSEPPCSYWVGGPAPRKFVISAARQGYTSRTVEYKPKNQTDKCGDGIEEHVTIELEPL